jgi:hypothetical protein
VPCGFIHTHGSHIHHGSGTPEIGVRKIRLDVEGVPSDFAIEGFGDELNVCTWRIKPVKSLAGCRRCFDQQEVDMDIRNWDTVNGGTDPSFTS